MPLVFWLKNDGVEDFEAKSGGSGAHSLSTILWGQKEGEAYENP